MQNTQITPMEQKSLWQAVNAAELASVYGGGFFSDLWDAAKDHFWCGVAGVATSAGTANPALGIAAYAACQGAL